MNVGCTLDAVGTDDGLCHCVIEDQSGLVTCCNLQGACSLVTFPRQIVKMAAVDVDRETYTMSWNVGRVSGRYKVTVSLACGPRRGG